ncbi:hypothetical protein C1Y40_05499 [Mycobacterium talmoniae]|uniref:Uncharacterized protein n=1 Tax=Mycobacterium talmoniae TaxID=1858794 RepID=A0A2S8BCF0_9MYCO|nr:hypothetical protein C1Y40_05499 [Mycobacterium talmoniae]
MRARLGEFGQHAAVGRQAAGQLLEAGVAAGFGDTAGAAHQGGGAPQHRTGEHRLAFDLRIAHERRLDAGSRHAGTLRETQIHQIAEIVGGETQFQRHRSGARGALAGSGAPGTAQLLGSGPQHRLQAAFAGQRADHLAGAAVGQQPQRPVQRGFAGAVGAGDDGQPPQRQHHLAQATGSRAPPPWTTCPQAIGPGRQPAAWPAPGAPRAAGPGDPGRTARAPARRWR